MQNDRESQLPTESRAAERTAEGRRPYRTPSVRTSRLYERAALTCTFDGIEWVGSTS